MSDPNADTPPSGTPAIATPYDLVKLLLATRSEVALLNERLRASNAPAEVASTPTKAQAVAKVAGGSSKWMLIALGALGVAAQVAAQFKPGLVSPLQTLIQLLQTLAGQ